MTDKTLALIKPDATERELVDAIIKEISAEGFIVRSIKQFRMDETLAGKFYEEHKHKPFFSELVDYMMSGDIVALELESKDAVSRFRTLIGATDPLMANEGTIRKKYALSRDKNAVHGSDSDASADRELSLIFG